MAEATSRFAAFRTTKAKIILGILAAIVIAIASFMMTFLPAKLALPAVDVGALPPAAPPAGMSISRLSTGTYENPAAMAFRGGSFSDVRQFAATAVFVRHPKGNLLIDTGFGKNIAKDMKLLPSIQQSAHHVGTTVVDQFTAGGLGLADIAGIIPTHAHWDHISGIADLPGVPVLEAAEAQRWIASKAKGTEVMNSFGKVPYRDYRFDGGPYLGFAHSHDVWGDGSVVIVPAPGHTPDSVIVFVNLPSGTRYALIGDLVWQVEGLDLPAEKPWMLRWMIGEDRDEVHKDLALIRAAQQKFPQIRAIPAHDSSALGAIPQFPASAR